jgi:hypothetical protein
MKWDERGCQLVDRHLLARSYLQVDDLRKTSDPTARFNIRSLEDVGAVSEQSFGITGGRG